jgi:hypothetical protein
MDDLFIYLFIAVGTGLLDKPLVDTSRVAESPENQ